MRVSNQELGKYYASLPDEALREIDPAELTEAARQCYELETAKRRATRTPAAAPVDEDDEQQDVHPEQEKNFEVEPGWLEHAECAISYIETPGLTHAPAAGRARDALLAAGIPAHLTTLPAADHDQRDEYRVMVPASLYLKALSVLDQEIFNPELEESWRTHLGTLTHEEFQDLDLDDLCAGMLDRVERLTRAYNDEVALREGKGE